MAARESCANLIARLRRFISDPAGADQVWDDDELQEFLDARREHVDLECLTPRQAPSDGTLYYLVYTASRGDWEEDAALFDSGFDAVTPDTSDYLAGRWEFSAEPSYPLYLTGATFDLYGAAADVLEAWAAGHKLEFAFKSADQSLNREQKMSNLLKLADYYRKRSRPRTATLVRSDVATGETRSDYLRMLRS